MSQIDVEQIRRDEILARRIQEQEDRDIQLIRPVNPQFQQQFPLLHPQPLDPLNGPVQRNVRRDLSEVQVFSPRVLAVFMTLWIAELVATAVVLTLSWEDACDKPLKLWLLLFSSRIIIQIPIRMHYFIQHRADRLPNQRVVNLEKMVKLVIFIWFIFGQIWVYNVDSCGETSPLLYKYSLTLIVIVYVSLAMPIIILLALCLCLPCVLVLLRFFGDNRGASNDQIQNLPEKKFRVDSAEELTEPPMCAICMCEYEAEEMLRVLPCKHEFHSTCVDRWLKVKRECPLCRGDISAAMEEV